MKRYWERLRRRNWKPLLPWLSSFLAHALLLLWWAAPQINNFAPQSPEAIEIAPLPPQSAEKETAQRPATPKSHETEVAETEDAKNREQDPDAKFLSDRNQKAEKETRARLTDDFRGKQGTGLKGAANRGETPPTGSGEGESLAEAPRPAEIEDPKLSSKSGAKRNWKTLSLKDLGINGSGGLQGATDDRLSGVDVGENTVLSTREFKYFSYYHRIKEMLRQYWKPNVERKLAMLWGKGKALGEEEVTTRLLVMLDQQGVVQKISKLSSSGIVDLDEAAIEAFQRAAPFPNPPKGIVDEDGFVRIRWDFILKTEAVPRIQFRNVGNPSGLR